MTALPRIEVDPFCPAFMGSADRDSVALGKSWSVGQRARGGGSFRLRDRIARLVGEGVIAALARKAKTAKLAGPPRRRYSSVLRSLAPLSAPVTPA